MERINYISQAISSAIYLLESEMQCLENEELVEEYQETIDKLNKALQLTENMLNA